jgi:uncharacterized phage protein gp47/JayE
MLQTLNFTTLVQNMAAAVQSSASSLLNLTVGSTLRAVLEAVASVQLWLQWLILQVLSMTRASTSTGSDLDSWVADFDLERLPATPSSGPVTFSRFSTTTAALIQVGDQVKTSDGTRTFQVIADATNAAWNGSNGFTLPSGTASINITVQDVTTGITGALSVGAAGNVQANTIALLASAIPGIDTVTNASAFTNGIDAETDAALRARFSNYIQTRSRATLDAVASAIADVQQGLTWNIRENVNAAGVNTLGTFTVTVDDGTGDPSSTLLDAVSTAIAAVRPIGTTYAVQGPADVTATIALTITTSPSNKKAGLLAPVQAAVVAYVNALPIGGKMPYSRIATIAYAVDPSIVDVTGVTLNGGTSDLTPAANGVVKATTGSVTVS